MEELKKFLSRIRNELNKDEIERQKVSSCIKDILGFDIEDKNIFINNFNLRIQTTPAKRSEIKLNEQKILSSLREKGMIIERISF